MISQASAPQQLVKLMQLSQLRYRRQSRLLTQQKALVAEYVEDHERSKCALAEQQQLLQAMRMRVQSQNHWTASELVIQRQLDDERCVSVQSLAEQLEHKKSRLTEAMATQRTMQKQLYSMKLRDDALFEQLQKRLKYTELKRDSRRLELVEDEFTHQDRFA